MPKSHTPVAGLSTNFTTRSVVGPWRRFIKNGSKNELKRGKLRDLPHEDSINLECFRALPSVRWSKNWLPIDKPTTCDIVVRLLNVSGFYWSDLGTLYILIRDEDLKARAFEKCWVDVQST
jgi:uncharacterized protein DUF1963